MLQVQNFKQKQTRSTEASFERRFASHLTAKHVYSRHMSDALPGLPDRYVAPANWIEFKSIQRARRGFTMYEGLSVEQRRTMTDLSNAGDRVYYCSLLDDTKTKKIFFSRWYPSLYGDPLDWEVYSLYQDKDIDKIIDAYFSF